jgi:hypothetical protein
MKEVTFTAANGDRVPQSRMYVDDLTALREDES